MFEVSVEREFCASHAITINGVREQVHGHNWHVTVVIGTDSLNEEGLLYDFHELQKHVDSVIAPFHNNDLNTVSPFDQVNPTAEHIARVIGQSVSNKLPAEISEIRATVTEAPGCHATYLMKR